MLEEITVKRIIVPLDGSDSSFKAARYAIKIAKPANAEIIFMHAVVNRPYVEYTLPGVALVHYIEEVKHVADNWYKDVEVKARKAGVKCRSNTILDITSAAEAIVNYAEDNKADLIVMGTKGRTGVKRFLLGSVASGVISHAKCSVLVVR
jgi:nucleotide-binding universal stress UspA family protein